MRIRVTFCLFDDGKEVQDPTMLTVSLQSGYCAGYSALATARSLTGGEVGTSLLQFSSNTTTLSLTLSFLTLELLSANHSLAEGGVVLARGRSFRNSATSAL
jgi:hypothetical protein